MTAVRYATVDDVRKFTLAQSIEFPDATIGRMIDSAVSFIDDETGRTWQGTQYENETYDGDGSSFLQLEHTDIQGVSSLKIKDNVTDTTYDNTVDTSDELFVKEEGMVIINPNADESKVFLSGPDTVSIAYTWGVTRSTTISTNLDTNNTTITISDTTGFPRNGYAIIKTNGVEEWVKYTSKTPTTLTGVSRGQRGTTAMSHSSGDVIFESAPDNINQLTIDIVANKMHYDKLRDEEIKRRLDKLKFKRHYVI